MNTKVHPDELGSFPIFTVRGGVIIAHSVDHNDVFGPQQFRNSPESKDEDYEEVVEFEFVSSGEDANDDFRCTHPLIYDTSRPQ